MTGFAIDVSFPGNGEDVPMYALSVGVVRLVERVGLVERVELVELDPDVVNAIVSQPTIRYP